MDPRTKKLKNDVIVIDYDLLLEAIKKKSLSEQAAAIRAIETLLQPKNVDLPIAPGTYPISETLSIQFNCHAHIRYDDYLRDVKMDLYSQKKQLGYSGQSWVAPIITIAHDRATYSPTAKFKIRSAKVVTRRLTIGSFQALSKAMTPEHDSSKLMQSMIAETHKLHFFGKLKPRGPYFGLIGGKKPKLVGILTMETVGREMLFNLIHDQLLEEPRLKFQVMLDAMYHIDVLHKRGCIHNDLKPENFRGWYNRLFDRWCVRPIDFGAAREVKDINQSFPPGTFYYMAPELLKDGVFDFATDVYSLGMMFRVLWDDSGFKEFLAIDKLDEFIEKMKSVDCKIPDKIPGNENMDQSVFAAACQLMMQMTAPVAANRISMEAAIPVAELSYLMLLLTERPNKNQHAAFTAGFYVGSAFARMTRRYRSMCLGNLKSINSFSNELLSQIQVLPDNDAVSVEGFLELQQDECLATAETKLDLIYCINQIINNAINLYNEWSALQERCAAIPSENNWLEEIQLFTDELLNCEISLDAISLFNSRISSKIDKIANELPDMHQTSSLRSSR